MTLCHGLWSVCGQSVFIYGTHPGSHTLQTWSNSLSLWFLQQFVFPSLGSIGFTQVECWLPCWWKRDIAHHSSLFEDLSGVCWIWFAGLVCRHLELLSIGCVGNCFVCLFTTLTVLVSRLSFTAPTAWCQHLTLGLVYGALHKLIRLYCTFFRYLPL